MRVSGMSNTATRIGHSAMSAAQALCGLGPFEYGADHWATDARRPFRLAGTGLASGV